MPVLVTQPGSKIQTLVTGIPSGSNQQGVPFVKEVTVKQGEGSGPSTGDPIADTLRAIAPNDPQAQIIVQAFSTHDPYKMYDTMGREHDLRTCTRWIIITLF
jgi:hypothetical protein